MVQSDTKKTFEKAQIKNTLEQMFILTLDQRINRYIELKPHEIIPNSHFAAVSAETHELYRDGHFYGTISLTQSVAEALAKFLCQKNGWEPHRLDYKKNIKQLKTRGKISSELTTLFIKIWKGRNNYHHLNPGIEQDRQKLEVLAKEKLTCLKSIEKELFAYLDKGKLIPKHPKYWDQKNGTAKVFLRFD